MTKSRGIRKDWTPEEDAILTTMWKERKQATTIALSLGNRSEKAVWNRVEKLGLKRVATVKHLKSMDYRETSVGIKAKPVFKRSPIASIAYGEPVGLLKANGCRFIVEGLELCCNASQMAGSAYCEDHRNLCYQKKVAR